MDDGEVPGTLTIDDILGLESSHLPSASLLPLTTTDQPQNESQSAFEIDWISLLSGSFKFGDHQKPSLPVAEGDGGKVERDKKFSRAKKTTPPRIAFHTRSVDDILDDGYRWRKYGQKAVKNSVHPRRYYRCTHHTCDVKKQIQRLSKDPGIVVTTYEGVHNHPCEQLMERLSPLLKQLQFLSGI